jgi:hypothetical protein
MTASSRLAGFRGADHKLHSRPLQSLSWIFSSAGFKKRPQTARAMACPGRDWLSGTVEVPDVSNLNNSHVSRLPISDLINTPLKRGVN